MCGITGFLHPALPDSKNVLKRMTDAIRHRGPDAEGSFLSEGYGIGLGHRRLSIIDLSPNGAQPMTSHTGRFVIVFNGEIYNFADIRNELETKGHKFRGSSDTEVMLAAFEQWEIYEAIPKFNGMFAFALWDNEKRKLYLCRDRLGVKPLYYGEFGRAFVFGSEIKSLLVHPNAEKNIDPTAVTHFMRFGYVPSSLSIFKNIRKLSPGTVLTISNSESGFSFEKSRYWSATVSALSQTEHSDDPASLVSQLHTLLRDSVKLRMIADVPLGAFLSGGIDSSTIVGIMQEYSSKPVRTFSIGFSEIGYNEAPEAKLVAEHLRTNHTELYLTPEETRSIIPELPKLYDEPFGDISAIPTYLVSKLAREHVTVSLSGDGGDELFLGYSRYHGTKAIWQLLRFMSPKMRKVFGHWIGSTSTSTWDKTFNILQKVLPENLKVKFPGDRLHRLARRMDATDFPSLYRNAISHWPRGTVLGDDHRILPFLEGSLEEKLDSFSYMSLYDLITYLPDDILVKLDRASMAHGLEAREPLLDYRIVEFALRLPTNVKIRGNESKWILRRILEQYVPKTLTDRPKMGFGVPVDSWLRGPLRAWAEELILSDRLKNQNIFDPKIIRSHWNDHIDGRANHMYLLWDILMFQAWFREWKVELWG